MNLSAIELIEQGHNEANCERLWEAKLQQMGSERYENSLTTKDGKPIDFSRTSSGKWFLQHAHFVVEKAISELQRDIITKDKRALADKGTVTLVPPRDLTGIVLKTMIDRVMGGKPSERNVGIPLQSVVLKVSSAVENTVKLLCDIQESRREAREWWEKHGQGVTKTPPMSHAEKLIKEVGVSKMAYSRWRGALKELLEYKWSVSQEYYGGEALVVTAVEALMLDAHGRGEPAPFVIHAPHYQGKNAKRLKVGPEFAAFLESREIRKSQSQVVRLPMLTRPIAWTLSQ